MFSLLLVTALAVVQYPTPAEKPAAQDTARQRPSVNAPANRDTARAQSPTTAAAFRADMRRLWQDHIGFTRNFIVSANAGLGDTTELTERLLRNQDEIGDALKPYYGDAAGSRLAGLLRGHIQLAAKAIAATRSTETAMDPFERDRGDQEPSRVPARDTGQVGPPANVSDRDTTGGVNVARDDAAAGADDTLSGSQAVAALRANADSIATFLSSANPRHWSRATLQGALHMHLDLLLQQANARAQGDWEADIAAYDASQRQVLQMADMLSDGVIKQFPNRFTGRTTAMSGSQ
ncbi:MAG: hypothetical protein ACREME_06050 [Gemmatimonadales bacterium]